MTKSTKRTENPCDPSPGPSPLLSVMRRFAAEADRLDAEAEAARHRAEGASGGLPGRDGDAASGAATPFAFAEAFDDLAAIGRRYPDELAALRAARLRDEAASDAGPDDDGEGER